MKTNLEQACKKRVDVIVKKLKDSNFSRYEEQEYTLDFLKLFFSCHGLFYGPKKTDSLIEKMEQAVSKKYN